MSLLLLLLPLFLQFFEVKSESCGNSTPLHLPLRDVQVLSDVQGSYMRGISAKIGTPEQDIVLIPWP